MSLDTATIEALRDLRRLLPEAVQVLGLDSADLLRAWTQALDVKLLPRLAPDFPLVAAVCGGGSAGKSTLFNSLAGQPISPTGGRAGLNRRVLAALHQNHAAQGDVLNVLARSFGNALQPMEESGQLVTPGPPLYWSSPSMPAQVVLLDTPDIDTGARGRYTNRDAAGQSLEASDIFIYIFTNSTYNNRDNTDFMARMLTGIGTRPSYLVYRVYLSFSDDEVRAHARTVAQNIYGAGHEKFVLGILRSDDENSVAAGEKPMTLRPLVPGECDLATALGRLDPLKLREQVLGSMLTDAMEQADGFVRQAQAARDDLDRYATVLTGVQRQCVRQALSHFPSDRVLRRFAQIWLKSDPGHIKFMRRTGRLVEWPYRTLLKVVRHSRAPHPAESASSEGRDPVKMLEIDLLTAANQLYQKTLDQRIQDERQSAEAHAVVRSAQEQLRRKDWKATLGEIQAQKALILSWSDQLESELKALADNLRSRMGLMDQIRQTFAALLNVIPTTAAITYILHTGDPVGAAGIKVKLTGIFGLKDLYALIAIPATAGMKKADQRQLEMLLAPVARAWLEHKLQAVETLFETQITGQVLDAANSARSRADELIREARQNLSACKESLS